MVRLSGLPCCKFLRHDVRGIDQKRNNSHALFLLGARIINRCLESLVERFVRII